MSAMKHYAEDMSMDLEDYEVFEMMATQEEYNFQAAQHTNPEDWITTLTDTINATTTNPENNGSERQLITFSTGHSKSRLKSSRTRVECL